MKLRQCICLLMCMLCLGGLMLMTACQNDSGVVDDTTEQTQADTPVNEDEATMNETNAETTLETTIETEEVVEQKPYTYPAEMAGAATQTVLYAKDFGVVGDGVTDDGMAISAAVRAAVEQKATLTFEGDKTYYIASSDNSASVFHSPFAMSDAKGVTIDGQGATFKVTPGVNYFALVGCENIKITNCHFDYAVPVYMVGEVLSVTETEVTYRVDIEPNTPNYDFSNVNGFSIKYNQGTQERPHMFMGQMIKTGDKQVKVTYKNPHHYAVGDLVFLPNPGVGHAHREAIYMGNCQGAVVLENVGIHAAPTFIFAIKSNQAEMYFENVDLTPAANHERQIKMVSWRDGYHCKDNRLPIHWNNCEADVLFDDVFNISGTLGCILDVKSDAAFTVANYEHYTIGQRVAFDCQVGDMVDIYDISGGSYCGSATIRLVDQNADGTTSIVLDYGQHLPKAKAGYVVANRETCAPGSTIKNCHFQGTFRFLRDLRVENTTFDMLAMWIMVEGSVEGPLPGDIDFIGCTFNGGRMEIEAFNRGSGRYLRQIARYIQGIAAHGCTFSDDFTAVEGKEYTLVVYDTIDETKFSSHIGAPLPLKPVIVTPVKEDFLQAVVFDYDRYTLPMTGGEVLDVAELSDATIAAMLQNAQGFSSKTVVLSAEAGQSATLILDGLSADALPYFHEAGNTYLLTFNYFTTGCEGGNVTVTGVGDVATDIWCESGRVNSVSVSYQADGNGTGVALCVTGGKVYIGNIRISLASNQNPTQDQLEAGHTFEWSNQVTIGSGNQVLTLDDVTDAAAKAAMQDAKTGFESGKVLHMTNGFGEFTGLTEASYYAQGKTYQISMYAYVKTPVPTNQKVYLIALDSTPGNRVLVDGLFAEAGIYHLTYNWTVGDTGESGLTFFFNGENMGNIDVYIGDLTISVPVSMKPDMFVPHDDFRMLTFAEMAKGHTFDMSEGNLLATGIQAYTSLSYVKPKAAEAMRAAGFGDTVYYAQENFYLESFSGQMRGGKTYQITMQVYDCLGNLATSGARGAFVLLRMTKGGQNSAEVSYVATVDPNDSHLVTLTFTVSTPTGTDGFLLYELTSCEYFIGSVTITSK